MGASVATRTPCVERVTIDLIRARRHINDGGVELKELPTGVVTLMFSDIEGSTQHWEHEPASMSAALRRHDVVLRTAIESAGGSVFKTVGDAFCSVFSSPVQAVLAAQVAQGALLREPWTDGLVLKVRIAIHTGRCEERDGDFFGPTVNKVARIEAAGHGGQVLCSQATAELVKAALPTGVTLRSLGAHQLADIDEPEEIHQLEFPGLPSTFPSLRIRHLALRTNNLPTALSSFVGRTSEVGEVIELLHVNRVVTISGSGGVGKTRLAIEVARALIAEMKEGVWLVELAEVDDPASVPGVVLSELEISERRIRNETDVLLDVLADQQRLIVLDNCEHLVDVCAQLSETIATGCPGVRILATSREPLRIEGEVTYRVPPLSLPPDDATRASELQGSAAVELLLQRAKAHNPKLVIVDEDASAVALICRRLDGIPLAIELAAARLGSMTFRQLNERIEHRFALLTGGSRTALPRQQTLHAMIDWSFDLLESKEKVLFRRLCVFRGGFDLEAVENVCPLDDLSTHEIADLVASLVDKSLINAIVSGENARYTMLETIHAYGSELLASMPTEPRGEASELKAAHARYFVEFFERVESTLRTPAGQAWKARAIQEQENLLLATESLVDEAATGDAAAAVLGLRLLGATATYANSFREHARFLELLDRALGLAGPDPLEQRAAALFCKAQLVAYRSTNLEVCLVEALDAARLAGTRRIEVTALSMLSSVTRNEDYGAQAVAIARELDEPSTLAMALDRHAVSLFRTDQRRARSLLLESLDVSLRAEDIDCEAHVRVLLSAIDLEEVNLREARGHLDAIDALFGRYTPPSYLYHLFLQLTGFLELESGNTVDAERTFAYALREARRAGLGFVTAYALLGLACCASQLGLFERAAILHGGAQAVIDANDQTWDSLEDGIRSRDLELLAREHGNSLDRALLAGATMPSEELVALALRAGDDRASTDPPSPRSGRA
jgi:predicted ATPase/class 3 adenylate cyclase